MNPIVIWITGLPFGIAAQYLFMTIALIVLVLGMRKQKLQSRLSYFMLHFKVPLILMVLEALWLLVSTQVNGYAEPKAIREFLAGRLFWIASPFLFFIGTSSFNEKKYINLTCMVFIFLGLIGLSQYIWLWKIEGIKFVSFNEFRPRGLYSHPLTLAYCLILWWPLFLELLRKSLDSKILWISNLSLSFLIFATSSRTVQAVALIILLTAVALWEKKTRLIAIGVSGFVLLLAMFVPNQVNQRIKSLTFTNEHRIKMQEKYLDDRLAFWDAHWLMIKERPIIGHGVGLNEVYRTPYYEKLGLSDFRDKFPAHNTFIQETTEGGVIGLLLFLSWFGWILVYAFKNLQRRSFWVTSQIVIGYLVASITQNSFQDSVVRIHIITLFTLFLLYCNNEENKSRLPNEKASLAS